MKANSGDCYTRALRLLAGRPHSVKELEKKLSTRGFGESEIQGAVTRLLEGGYLNDSDFGVRYAKARVERARVGPARLKMDLKGKGLDVEVVETSLSGVYGEDGAELAIAIDAATRKARALTPGVETEAAKKKIFDHLIRKGFSAETARRVVFQELRRIMEKGL